MRLEQSGTPGQAIDVLKELFDHYGEDEDICLALYGRMGEMGYLTNTDGSRVSHDQLRTEHKGGTMAEAHRTRFDEFIEGYRAQVIDEGITIGRQKGRQEGRLEGRQEGLVRERELLGRQAAKRFNGHTAKRLDALLKDVDDPNVLDKVGEAIIDCRSGKEFIEVCKGLGSS